MARRKRSLLELTHSPVPFGLGATKPHHFYEMARVMWENRDNLSYAWKVLSRGVCDGCALGTTGLRDWTIDGTHLCMVRLELLRLNTMSAFDPKKLADLSKLKDKSSKELREMGRLGFPMRRRKGEAGFTQVSWEEAWKDIGERWRAFDAQRTSMYLTSRGITNEVYYVAQKVMRFLGTNNVDNSARLCHSPSTAGLKSTLGVAATTCSYKDMFEADVIVFFGSNPANDQPVTLKYLFEARKRGARVLMVNAYKEPGMARYWIPSNMDSALFGTTITDRFFLVRIGGDLAFITAVQKRLIERGEHNKEFIAEHCEGFDEFKAHLESLSLDELCELSGASKDDIEAFTDEIAKAETGIFVWSMGITQHKHGSDNVRAICNLAMLKEFMGRPGTGCMPIRGHSGVQGGAEMGAYSTVFPGGKAITEDNAKHFSALWGFEVPHSTGLTTVGTFEAGLRGEIDGFYCVGGNFLETMPEPEKCREALSKMKLRVHTDIIATTQMFVEPADTVYLLPSRTRYEQQGGGTETTTERRVIYSPYIPGHDVGEARSEWEMLLEFAKAVAPDRASQVHFESADAIREDISRSIPAYEEIKNLKKQGDQFQWGGPRLCAGRSFGTDSGKARFFALKMPDSKADTKPIQEREFRLATRRGKQFNSMVQRDVDPLTGADRDHIWISQQDAKDLGLKANGALTLKNEWGEFKGRAFVTDMVPGTLMGHWPEVNGLIPLGPVDDGGGVPDYNAVVKIDV